MIREIALATELKLTTETLLWRGVIARTIQDWLSKPLRPKRAAERYLFENSADLSLVCSSAGINVLKLRTCLNNVRGRTLEGVLAVAAQATYCEVSAIERKEQE
jgi:hypothetical protein